MPIVSIGLPPKDDIHTHKWAFRSLDLGLRVKGWLKIGA